MSGIKNIITEKCPVCGKGKVFGTKGNPLLFRLPEMNGHCSECGHKFEKEPGYFFGSMYVSYAISIVEMVAFFLVVQFFVESYVTIAVLIAVLAVLLSTFNFRLSRMIWIYIFDNE